MEYIIIVQGFVIITLLIILLIRENKGKQGQDISQVLPQIDKIKDAMSAEAKATRQETSESTIKLMKELGEMIAISQRTTGDMQGSKITEMTQRSDENHKKLVNTLNTMIQGVDNRMSNFTKENEQKLENIRTTVKESLKDMQQENGKKLDEMRLTVDQKLQRTLEERIGQSFKIVSDRLEQVYKGLGEMQTLASGVGDLKKILSNVKTRGILGEIQLGAILEQILSPEQYDTNVATIKGSKNVVEYAVKLPGNDDGVVYLPIDSKFPGDAYSNLVNAYESGDQAEVERCGASLERVIKLSAKDIRDKYIETPYTTDFGIMFLPFEGLYAEVVRRGLVETLQRDYRINIAGPTTMAALLNSLQMGFRTLAVQKRTSEVWNILGAVKTEFDKFGVVLEATQQRLDQANKELDKLVGVRTRQIQRKLKDVTYLAEDKTSEILDKE